MSNRISDKVLYDKAASSVLSSRKKLISNQEKASSGKRINRPSDGPTDTVKLVGIKNELARNQQLQKNLSNVNNMLSITESSLGDLSDVVARAKEIAISMSSVVNQNDNVYSSAAQEVEQLFLRAVQIGNARVGNRYIFGGFQTERPPFDTDGNYYGDTGQLRIEVAPNQYVGANVPGALPFFGVKELPHAIEENLQNGVHSGPSISANPELSTRAPASSGKEVSKQSKEAGDQAMAPDQSAQRGSFKGTQEIGVLNALRSLQSGLTGGSVELVNNSLDELDIAFDQIVTARSQAGSRQKTLELTLASLESSEMSGIERRSELEDADALKVFSDLTKNENALNATLEVNKRLVTKSLLDFLV